MKTGTNMAKQEILDKLEVQIKTADAKLDTLTARAETAKANVEIKAITEMLTVLVLFGAHEKEAESPKRVLGLAAGFGMKQVWLAMPQLPVLSGGFVENSARRAVSLLANLAVGKES
jgi:hypothetical protein